MITEIFFFGADNKKEKSLSNDPWDPVQEALSVYIAKQSSASRSHHKMPIRTAAAATNNNGNKILNKPLYTFNNTILLESQQLS